MNWKKTSLKDLFKFRNGKAPSRSSDGEYPVFGSHGQIGLSKDYRHEDAIIIGRVGAYCGAVELCRGKFWPSDNTIVATPKNGHDVKFLYYLLDDFPLRRFAGGSAQPLLTQKLLKTLDVEVPDANTQKRIADILSAFDDLIEVNRQRIERLERAARLLYREWFVHHRFPGHEHTEIVDGVPEGWEQVNLSELVSTQYGYTESASEEIIGPHFLRGTDINKTSYVDWNSVPYCEIGDSDYQKYQLKKHDIVVIRMADPGKCAIVEDDVDAVFASYLIRVTIETQKITPYFLFFVLDDQHYQQHISTSATGATRKSASAGLLVDYEVLVPPKLVIEDFECEVVPMRQQISALLRQNSKLKKARDILLPRLMSGEITV
jgi:type I restriction enzyme S subunit